MCISELSRTRWRRRWTSASAVLAGALSIAVLIEIGKIATAGSKASPSSASDALGVWWIVGIGAVSAVLLFLRAHSEYRKKTYDPTWAIKFTDWFGEEAMREARSRAAKTLQEFYGRSVDRGSLLSDPDQAFENLISRRTRDYEEFEDIEDVLDFFEELGFYVNGDQVTAELAHQSFFYWIEVYYRASKKYVTFCQEESGPTAWEHIEYLYKVTRDVEKERSRDKFNEIITYSKFEEFLRDEIALTKVVPKRAESRQSIRKRHLQDSRKKRPRKISHKQLILLYHLPSITLARSVPGRQLRSNLARVLSSQLE
jgi:hypothetical protein